MIARPMATSQRDRLYAQYEKHAKTADHDRAPYLRWLVQREFPEDRSARVLDLGCGDGALLRAAEAAGYRDLRGVDGAPGLVERAHELGSSFVEQGDLLETLRKSASATYDVVIAFDVLEHLEGEEQMQLADEAFRVLSQGGRLLVHVPNGESPFVGSVLFADATHVTAFTATSLRQILGAAGFSGLRLVEDRPVVHGARSAVRHVLWRMIRGLIRALVAIETGSRGADSVFSRNLLAVASK